MRLDIERANHVPVHAVVEAVEQIEPLDER
jgi:hypothetical protein